MRGGYWRRACALQARAQLPVTLVLGMSISVAALRHMLPVKAADLLQAKEFRLVQVCLSKCSTASCMLTQQLLVMLTQHLYAPAELARTCRCQESKDWKPVTYKTQSRMMSQIHPGNVAAKIVVHKGANQTSGAEDAARTTPQHSCERSHQPRLA